MYTLIHSSYSASSPLCLCSSVCRNFSQNLYDFKKKILRIFEIFISTFSFQFPSSFRVVRSTRIRTKYDNIRKMYRSSGNNLDDFIERTQSWMCLNWGKNKICQLNEKVLCNDDNHRCKALQLMIHYFVKMMLHVQLGTLMRTSEMWSGMKLQSKSFPAYSDSILF